MSSRRVERLIKLRTLWRGLRLALLLVVLAFLAGGAAIPPGGLRSDVQVYTRPIEFDYGTWTLDAMGVKLSSWALSLNRFLPPEAQVQWVLESLDQVQSVDALSAEILTVYTDPEISDPDAASAPLRADLQGAQSRLDSLMPVAESILQAQLSDVLNEIGLGYLGQVLPPSLYRGSDVPRSLVISPRDEIVQVLDISLSPGLDLETMQMLEDMVFTKLDHAALVVPIGGVGTYPTMVRQTADLVWLTEVIAHEWVHNFLTLRPLGMNYFTSEELRTINETTASLAGKEIGLLILEKYYPDHIPAEPVAFEDGEELQMFESEPEAFDFQTEMRITREEVDRLLAEGEIETAEAYMEARRQFFWENGFQIRKLNQAYFAFYGAYNDTPGGGAAGEDPVGPAVVAFREQFDALADFLNAISRVDSFEKLSRLSGN